MTLDDRSVRAFGGTNAVVADELLGVMRAAAGVDALDYAAEPARLLGGFFTENYAFQLSGVEDPWNRPLALRTFPALQGPTSVRVEVETQRHVVAQGYPAAPVVVFDPDLCIAGRLFMVMERLPGISMLGAIGPATLIRRGPRLMRDLPRATAQAQAALHALDPDPLLDAMGEDSCGVARWFAFLEERVDSGAVGFADGLRWLVTHQPRDPARRAICHGDLWPGNLLVEGDAVSGVLDWTVATVAEPAFDVGYTTMAFDLAPVEVPTAVYGWVARAARRLGRRYVSEYQRVAPQDLRAQPYYEALRCACELSAVADYRLATRHGRTDVPRPTWARITGPMIEYFRTRTGVELALPPVQ